MSQRDKRKLDIELSVEFQRTAEAVHREAQREEDEKAGLIEEVNQLEAELNQEEQKRLAKVSIKSPRVEPNRHNSRQQLLATTQSRTRTTPRSRPSPVPRRDMLALRRERQSQSLNHPPVEHEFYDLSGDDDVDDVMPPAAPVVPPPHVVPPHAAAAPVIDLTLTQSPELAPAPAPAPAIQPPEDNKETRQDLLRLRRLEIALRDANNFPSDTKILDWARVKRLPQTMLTRDILLCFVRCRYVVTRAWARLSTPRSQSLISMIRSQQGCTFFVQMTQFFRQMSRLVSAQRNLTNAQLAELDHQHRRAASFFENEFLQPSDVLPARPIDITPDDNAATQRIVGDPAFHSAIVIAEACSQPGAVRTQAQPDWDLAEQLQGPVASAVNAAFAEIKTWYEQIGRVAPADLTRVLKDEQALPRFAEWIALLTARQRLAFNARYVRNDVSEIINMRTAQARQWLQMFYLSR